MHNPSSTEAVEPPSPCNIISTYYIFCRRRQDWKNPELSAALLFALLIFKLSVLFVFKPQVAIFNL